VSYLQQRREKERKVCYEQMTNLLRQGIKGALPAREAKLAPLANQSGMQIADLRGKGILSYGCDHKNVLDNKSNL